LYFIEYIATKSSTNYCFRPINPTKQTSIQNGSTINPHYHSQANVLHAHGSHT